MNQIQTVLKRANKITTNTQNSQQSKTQQQPSTPKFGEVIISQDRERDMYKLEKLCK